MFKGYTKIYKYGENWTISEVVLFGLSSLAESLHLLIQNGLGINFIVQKIACLLTKEKFGRYFCWHDYLWSQITAIYPSRTCFLSSWKLWRCKPTSGQYCKCEHRENKKCWLWSKVIPPLQIVDTFFCKKAIAHFLLLFLLQYVNPSCNLFYNL